ncbi:MAG: divergent polysaccharide deacetylase family protein [Kiritimatiellales bacterium]|nr:divergent polysaccharide deacetylase family protein [Kiritimatiellales bacterium]
MRLILISLSIMLLFGCRAPAPQKSVAVRPAPAAVRQKQIFLVIDDAGLALDETQQFLDLPIPLTMAVLPHLKETSRVCAAIARHPDKEIILHQPMEAYDASQDAGPGVIRNTTRPSDVPAILARNLASVRGAKGMNNHMGSRVTENPEVMQAVLRYCKANGLLFLDSKTAYNSQVERLAQYEHMHFEGRDVFLDIQHDRAYIRKMWGQAVAKARTQGYAIVIGHAWSAETAATIRDSFQTLENQGYTFHLLSELYR